MNMITASCNIFMLFSKMPQNTYFSRKIGQKDSTMQNIHVTSSNYCDDCYAVHHISYDRQITIAATKYLNSHNLLPAWPRSSVGRATVI